VPAGLSDLSPAVAAFGLYVATTALLGRSASPLLVAGGLAFAHLGVAAGALVELGLGAQELSGPVGNPNHLAAVLAVTAPAVAFTAWQLVHDRAPGPAGAWRALGVTTALLLPGLAVIARTGCRSALLAAGTALLLGMSLGLPTPRARYRALAASGAIGLASLGALLATSTATAQAAAGRGYLARISLSLGPDHPLLGQGVGGYAFAFLEAQGRHLALHPGDRGRWTNATTAHCEPIQALVELGLPGAVLVVLLGALAVRAGLRHPAPAPRLGFVMLAALAVTSLSEGVLHTAPMLAVAALALAILVAGSEGAGSGPDRGQRWTDRLARSPGPGVLLVLAAATAAVLGTRQYVAERLLGRARRTADPVTTLRRAERWATQPGRIRFYLGLALAERGAPEPALTLLRRSRADFPNLGTHVAAGNVLMRLGRPAEAEREYRRAVFLNPRYAAAQHNLGLALRAQGKTAEAEAQLARARRLWPGRWSEPWRLRVVERLLRSAEDAPPDSALAQP
jgi:hypothetical protein